MKNSNSFVFKGDEWILLCLKFILLVRNHCKCNFAFQKNKSFWGLRLSIFVESPINKYVPLLCLRHSLLGHGKWVIHVTLQYLKACNLCQIMQFMSYHVIHVKSCNSGQIMLLMLSHSWYVWYWDFTGQN
jgi:hypothetical protein